MCARCLWCVSIEHSPCSIRDHWQWLWWLLNRVFFFFYQFRGNRCVTLHHHPHLQCDLSFGKEIIPFYLYLCADFHTPSIRHGISSRYDFSIPKFALHMLRPRAWTSQTRITTINYHLCAQPLPLPKVHRSIHYSSSHGWMTIVFLFCPRLAKQSSSPIFVNRVDIDLNEISNCCLNSVWIHVKMPSIFELSTRASHHQSFAIHIACATVRPTNTRKSLVCVCALFSTAFRNQQNSHHFQLCVAVNLLSRWRMIRTARKFVSHFGHLWAFYVIWDFFSFFLRINLCTSSSAQSGINAMNWIYLKLPAELV